MNEFYKKIASTFGITEEEAREKLGTADEADSKAIAKNLGFYGLFQTKEELETYIKNKVQNKMKEIDSLTEQLNEKNNTINEQINLLNSLKSSNEQITTQIKNAFISEWKNLNYKPDYTFENLTAEEIDLNNLAESVKKYASKHNETPEIVKPETITKDEQQTTGVERFTFGSRRIL
ncbi:hypothetical protein [Mycoplasmopsis felifaucium]|uniref:hypothetical protein n=1 Tax=Mycoplasmopsis felifaucium TaxID=35768 RepID=UPI000486C251|nr:hypothetical protein [Mycoplasmopsis felifaucium]